MVIEEGQCGFQVSCPLPRFPDPLLEIACTIHAADSLCPFTSRDRLDMMAVKVIQSFY